MKIQVFQPPLSSFDDPELMAHGGEVKPAKMNVGGLPRFGGDPRFAANQPAQSGNSDYSKMYPAPTKRYGKGMQQFEINIIDSEHQRDLEHWNSNKSLFESGQTLQPQDEFPRLRDYIYKGIGNESGGLERARLGYQQDTQQFYAAKDEAAADAADATAADAAANDPDRLADFAARFSGGQLTSEEIQGLIDGGMTEQDVLTLIGNYQLTEDQLGQLYSQGLLTEEQIASLVQQEIAASEETGEVSEDRIQELVDSGQYTEEDINSLIAGQLEGYTPEVDLSGYATQEQLSGLEGQFQNFLTPEQLEGYVTSDQLADATANDYDDVIKGLTDQLGTLETKYQNVTDQYQADAVNKQITDTKDELSSFFARSAPTGGMTGSTSQFDSGTSFLPGGSPMANLIGGQREGQGQDAFNSYLKTFTPSYSSYDEPKSLDDYSQGSQPFMGAQYNNPFTGGYNMGGQVSNGIMDLTNFDTNVQPFQNAFRPNKPRN